MRVRYRKRPSNVLQYHFRLKYGQKKAGNGFIITLWFVRAALPAQHIATCSHRLDVVQLLTRQRSVFNEIARHDETTIIGARSNREGGIKHRMGGLASETDSN